MVLAAVNFSLYFQVIRGRTRLLLRNLELRVYAAIFLIMVALVTLSLPVACTNRSGRACAMPASGALLTPGPRRLLVVVVELAGSTFRASSCSKSATDG